MSSYEEKIISLLQKGKYKFEREKRFVDLRKGKYRYDFFVYAPCGRALVEVNGEQHYCFIPKFYKTQRDYVAAKERDRRKISYALANKIPIYIIPFWEIENLSKAADIFQPKFLALSRWKNDQDWQRFQNLTKRR